MKRIFLMACGLASATLSIKADVAASANYQLSTISIDGGGGRSSSANYAQQLAIASPAGSSEAIPDAINFGFTAQLNNAPIGVDDTRSHPQDTSVEIPIAGLLANDIDDDNDPIQLTQTDPFSEAGSTITVVGGSVFYAGRPGFTGVDHFKYYIVDSSGEPSSATVTIYLAPDVVNQPQNSVAAIRQPNGTILLRFKGPAGFDEYVIEASDSLTQPVWQPVDTVDAGNDGVVQYFLGAPTASQRYYRAVARNL